MAQRGHEIASHTWSHPNLLKLTPAEVEQEFARADAAIEREIGRAPLTLAYPFNHSTPEIRAIARRHYLAGRESQSGAGGEQTTLAGLNRWADEQIAEKKWGVLMMHGIGAGYAAFTDPDILRAHLRYVAAKRTEIWIDTFAAVAGYTAARHHATLTIATAAPRSLSCVLATSDPATQTTVLTLVFPIANAVSVSATRAGRDLPARATGESLQVDATPSADPISVTWR